MIDPVKYIPTDILSKISLKQLSNNRDRQLNRMWFETKGMKKKKKDIETTVHLKSIKKKLNVSLLKKALLQLLIVKQ